MELVIFGFSSVRLGQLGGCVVNVWEQAWAQNISMPRAFSISSLSLNDRAYGSLWAEALVIRRPFGNCTSSYSMAKSVSSAILIRPH